MVVPRSLQNCPIDIDLDSNDVVAGIGHLRGNIAPPYKGVKFKLSGLRNAAI